ncbi:MAG: lysozyme inhibitor LprI family protein [Novosphingobium sp.]|nr:lysozyme inhibitor LprI family protein [Novosphingobium sp.]
MILAPLLLVAAPSAIEPQWNCGDPGPQQEMNRCAAMAFDEADAALNAQWQLTAREMKRRDAEWASDAPPDKHPGWFETLLAAQRAWLGYRDAHCSTHGYIFRGGSMEPFMIATCKQALTEERTRQLREPVELE